MRKHTTPRIDIAGQTFGELTALTYVGGERWRSQCACGQIVERRGSELRSGNATSCGCKRRENISKAKCATNTFGVPVETLPEYFVWSGIKARCFTETNKDYPRYGARGITMCARWRNSLAAFVEDMGSRPSPKHTIDRYPDQNGNYEPGNCRWATIHEQANNKRNNHLLTFKCRTMTVTEWAYALNMRPSTLNRRLTRYKWSVEHALSTPVERRTKRA